MSDPIDFQAARAKREEDRERAEIRREGFASRNPVIHELASSIASQDWERLEELLADDEDWGDAMTCYLVLTVDRTKDAAPADPEAALEIARTLMAAASQVERGELSGKDMDVRDLQGRRVGGAQLVDSVPIGDPTGCVIRLVVKYDDATNHDHKEIPRILRQVAARVGRGDHLFTLRDPDGAVIGKFEWREPLQARGMQP